MALHSHSSYGLGHFITGKYDSTTFLKSIISTQKALKDMYLQPKVYNYKTKCLYASK